MKQKKSHKKAGGFTLVEITIVVVIFATFAALVVPILTGILNSNITGNNEVSSMSRTVKQIEERYYGQLIDNSFNTTEVIKAKLYAESYRTSGTTNLYNSFGGRITITGVADNGITWVSEKVSTDACNVVVTGSRFLGFETVSVGSNSLQYSASTPSDISNACDSASGTNDSVTITWTRAPA